MVIYRHRVSGRTVSYAQPNARLDGLPDRWERLDDEVAQGTGPAETAAKAAEAAADAAQHAADAAQQSVSGGEHEGETRAEVEAAAGDNGPSTDTGRVPAPVEQPGEALPERPAKSANRAVWAAYAETLGHEVHADQTKAQIVAMVDAA